MSAMVKVTRGKRLIVRAGLPLLVVLVIGGWLGWDHLRDRGVAEQLERFRRARIARGQLPVSELPPHVKAPQGELTLYADYDEVWQGKTVLYLVNRTAEDTQLRAQDYDLFLKLETRAADGRWLRAQTHVYSWCGNSYHHMILEPDTFIEILGWLPEEGEEREIRYKFYSDVEIASNVGAGLVDPVELGLAQYDEMSTKRALPVLEDILVGDAVLRKRLRDRRRTGDGRLVDLPPAEVLPILQELLESKTWQGIYLFLIVESLGRVAQDHLLGYAKNVLLDGPPELRSRLLMHRLAVEALWNDTEARSILLQKLTDPGDPDLRAVLSCLASLKVQEVEELLREIGERGGYSNDQRTNARMAWERHYGDKVVDVQFTQERVVAGIAPFPLQVTITNVSGRPLTFKYDKPSEIVSLYLRLSQAGEDGVPQHRFLEERPTVKWFAPNDSPHGTRVALARGRSHTVEMNLLDYFELPVDFGAEKTRLTITPSCRLPGIHEVPQLGVACSFVVPTTE